MKLLNYLFIIFGLYLFLKSIFDVRIYAELFEDRDAFAPELYRRQEKSADIASIIHNLYLLLYGLYLFVVGGYGTVAALGQGIPPLFKVLTLLSLLDFVFILFVEKRHGFKQVKEQIQMKWKREKVFDPDTHNGEVNMFRAVNRLERFKKQTCLSIVSAIILLFMSGTMI